MLDGDTLRNHLCKCPKEILQTDDASILARMADLQGDLAALHESGINPLAQCVASMIRGYTVGRSLNTSAGNFAETLDEQQRERFFDWLSVLNVYSSGHIPARPRAS